MWHDQVSLTTVRSIPISSVERMPSPTSLLALIIDRPGSMSHTSGTRNHRHA